MPPTISYSVFQKEGITSSIQQFFIIVCLQQKNICLLNYMFHVITNTSNISQHANIYFPIGNQKATGLLRIMIFGNSTHSQATNLYALIPTNNRSEEHTSEL